MPSLLFVCYVLRQSACCSICLHLFIYWWCIHDDGALFDRLKPTIIVILPAFLQMCSFSTVPRESRWGRPNCFHIVKRFCQVMLHSWTGFYFCLKIIIIVITTTTIIAIFCIFRCACICLTLPCPELDNIRVMVIVWRLRGNIIRTAVSWIVSHNVHSLQHTDMSSSYRSNRLDSSHWDPYIVHRGGCLELYYCNMVEWFWWDSSLISTTNWFPSVLWHCWFGHLACKNCPWNDL